MKLLFSLLLLIVSTQLSAQCEQIDCRGPYVSAFGGADWLHIRTDPKIKLHFKTEGFGGIALGYKLSRNFRLESEGGYRKYEIRKTIRTSVQHPCTHAYTWSFMVNGFVDIPVCYDIAPYFGAGVGYMNFYIDPTRRVKKSENIHGNAVQLITGVSGPFSDKAVVGIEYRYFRGKNSFYDQGIALTGRYFL